MELLGEDDVTGHDHIYAGQILGAWVNILPMKWCLEDYFQIPLVCNIASLAAVSPGGVQGCPS